MTSIFLRFLRQISLSILVAALALPARAQVAVQSYNGHDAVAQEVLIKFRQPAPGDAQAQAAITANVLQAQVTADIDVAQSVGSHGWVLWHSRSNDVATLMGLLTGASDLVGVEPNWVMHLASTPNDPYFPQEWGLQNTGQSILGITGTPGADIGAPQAWNISTGSASIVVAVLDTGIDYTHPDLAANVWSAPSQFSFYQGTTLYTCPAGTHGWNVLNNTCDPMDNDDHGTHVAETIGAAGNNGMGVTGVNWTTKIIAVKMCIPGNCSSANAANGIQFLLGAKAAFGGEAGSTDVRVLNNSYGGMPFAQSLLDEINGANAADMSFVVAAGNNGSNNDTTPVYPASYNAPNVISVAGTDNRDNLAALALQDGFDPNYGATSVDLGAPGAEVYSTWPSGSYGWMTGTSMATPHVSGTAALSESVCQFDTELLKPNLLNNVAVIPALVGKTVTGGRVNAFNSLDAASSACPGTGWSSVSGVDKHKRVCEFPGNCWIVWDSGYVSVTVNGYTTSANYSEYSTGQSLAYALRSAINNDANHPARAHVSGSKVSLSAKRTGSDTCYTLSVSSGSNDPEDFPTPSFSASPSGSALVGCR